MEEVIKYFESLEARLAGCEQRIAGYEERIATLEQVQQENEALIASLEADLDDLKNQAVLPSEVPEPQVVETEKLTPPLSQREENEAIEHSEPEPAVASEPEPEPEPEPVVETIAEEPVVAEEPASPKAAIYGKAVDDIRLAISLGDRFLYQRELFGQNAEMMQRTLTELNALGSFEAAMAYINEHFQWDTESNTYQQFLVTLHRRFG
jgi:uncharacterized coiled-coil protein SlyX